MTNIKEVEFSDGQGNIEVFIIEEFAANEFRSMPKTLWDELQSAKNKQSGTL